MHRRVIAYTALVLRNTLGRNVALFVPHPGNDILQHLRKEFCIARCDLRLVAAGYSDTEFDSILQQLYLFDVPQAQWIDDVPVYAGQHDLKWIVQSLKYLAQRVVHWRTFPIKPATLPKPAYCNRTVNFNRCNVLTFDAEKFNMYYKLLKRSSRCQNGLVLHTTALFNSTRLPNDRLTQLDI
jgi:hypothetical protein